MKIAFISMPYRGSHIEIQMNIVEAELVAMKYWALGYAVICPHLNSAHFEGAPEKVFLEGYLEILSRCDVIVMGYGWKHSEGAQKELALAVTLGLEIIYEEES